jgi:hypothetical protein
MTGWLHAFEQEGLIRYNPGTRTWAVVGPGPPKAEAGAGTRRHGPSATFLNPERHPWNSPCATKGGGTRRSSTPPAPAGPGAARTGTSPTPPQVSALVAWPGASTGSAGSGPPPPGGSARPGEHGASPADCPQGGVT